MPEKTQDTGRKNKIKINVRKSRLESLKINKKIIESPFKRIEKLQLQSWFHYGLCDTLWAILIRSSLGQEGAFVVFRQVILNIKAEPKKFGKILLTHSTSSDLDDSAFDSLFEPVFSNEAAREAVLPLMLIDCLPDRRHWARHLTILDADGSWNLLANAVGENANHQSQEATDVRWLKTMSQLANGKMHYPEHLKDMIGDIIEYPNSGDMRSVRPSIRANEGALRGFEEREGRGGLPWAETFWNECWEKTGCLPIDPDEQAERIYHDKLMKNTSELGIELHRHFLITIATTNVDARHDASFGIAFYLLQLMAFSAALRVGQALPARLILRTALECYITLKFLASKDDATVWLQFRNYGSGQARLSYIKMTDQDEMVSFISPETMKALASEDFWHEYLDIKLGSWSNKNLRDMASEAGVKPIYDRYYDALSGYVHGNWSAILHSSFGLCGNPLHRFHRIPHPPRRFENDATPDLVKLVNLSLDLITQLYPPFKPRLRLS